MVVSVEHILLLVLVVFLLYTLSFKGCGSNGFSVGGETDKCGSIEDQTEFCSKAASKCMCKSNSGANCAASTDLLHINNDTSCDRCLAVDYNLFDPEYPCVQYTCGSCPFAKGQCPANCHKEKIDGLCITGDKYSCTCPHDSTPGKCV